MVLEPPASSASALASADPPKRPPPIPKGTAVLHIGDSFTDAGFAKALRPRMTAIGARYEVHGEESTFTTNWASKLQPMVANTQPALVLITLGANEVANTEPATHAYGVKSIVRAVGGRPCVWISPPLWRKDTGIIDVIRTNSAPCRFFDSDRIVKQPIARQPDKIHPNEKGGEVWAAAFWAWLENERIDPSSAVVDASAKNPPKPSPWMLRPAPEDEHASRPTVFPPEWTSVGDAKP